MLGNLLRPWLLARLVTSCTAALLCLAVFVMAVQLLRAPALSRSNEGRLLVDRRAELLSSLARVASWASIASLIVAVIGADRLHGTLRGAMCAYGVLAATPYGFRSLFVAIAAALAASAWTSFHRAELALEEPLLTRAKILAAMPLLPLALGDLVLSTLHALSLDFREVASCCSSGLEAGTRVLGADGGPRTLAVAVFFGAGVLAILSAARNARAPSAGLGVLTSLTTVVALVAAPLAILSWVAPHAYGVPTHLCPFCLFHVDDAYGVGWLLYGALSIAVGQGLAVGAASYVEARRLAASTGSPAALRRILVQQSTVTSLAWLVTLALALLPWAVFSIQAGGASLFG